MTITRRQIALSAGALIASAGARQAQADDYTYAMLDTPAPNFSLPRFGGGRSALSDYRGRVLILAFGGLWCPECIIDGPNISRLADLAEADAEVDFLYLQCGPQLGMYGANMGARNTRDAVRAWRLYFREHSYDYPLAFDLSRRLDLSRHYAIQWFPSNLIIDRSGTIRAWRTTLGPNGGVNRFFAQARTMAQG